MRSDSNFSVTKNLHRWKRSLDERLLRVLMDASETLKWTWNTDKKNPKQFPMNTDYALHELKGAIKQAIRGNTSNARKTNFRLPPPPPPPSRLAELVSEGTIQTVYEQQNNGNYRDALKEAAACTEAGSLVWRKIWRAIDAAYQIDRCSPALAPKPKVHFLHRNLLEIAKMSGVGDLSHSGMVEFLDDTCPCGKAHKTDALRKLGDRLFGKK